MAFNVRSGGLSTPAAVANTIKSGDLVRVGDLVGIAEIDAFEGEDGLYYTTLAIEGIAHYPATGAIAAGTALYTATASGKVVLKGTGATGDKLVGVSTTPKVAGETDVWFKLIPNATVVSA